VDEERAVRCSLFALRCSSIANRERRMAISSPVSVEVNAGQPALDRISSRYDETVKTLNELYSSLSARCRYEVWFVRLGLADGGGAWWLRYLLMNPGRGGCAGDPSGMPVQVWATWFPQDGKPQSFIQGFPLEGLDLSARRQNPFHFRIGGNEIGESSCRGALAVGGHAISWDLQYSSAFRVTLSNKGWIGFSRTPHSDALFSGRITLDGRSFEGNPLGFGVQGHNCGYRHRNFWTWTHAYFPRSNRRSSTLPASAGKASTFEALVYEMPFGLVFRKAVLWHEGKEHEFRNLQEIGRDPDELLWNFRCSTKHGFRLEAAIAGAGPSIHRLPYVKTDCTSSFEVANNSLAKAVLRLEQPGMPVEALETSIGAVLEMVGR
jgi:hypothetical protein